MRKSENDVTVAVVRERERERAGEQEKAVCFLMRKKQN